MGKVEISDATVLVKAHQKTAIPHRDIARHGYLLDR
jgi:hypothetical protein